ncbi:MAG: sigma-70 family RNA polymerase sigma factor [Planctomycetaceae bacterium]|nr:sigma-70 family RNA polymerase sigma factor [Planctomycetaceae bacterium]MCB9951823.1 sigma-70 family RNA polymerase sigma factor [Planctomycetaceae bacterium]
MSNSSQSSFEAAFVAQLTEHQLALQLYVRSLLPGDLAAGDVTQQANTKIWEKRSDFELGTNFKAWAFSIARFEVLNYRKTQARDARLVFSGELEKLIESELAEANLDLQERHLALRECMGKLRTQDRQLLLHRYSSHGPLIEFAEAVGRSLGGLKVTLHRLRSALLTCMQQRLGTQEATP